MSDYKRADGSRRICRCECGGWVRGVQDFDRLWTWCTKCTPVQKMVVNPRKRKTASQVSRGQRHG